MAQYKDEARGTWYCKFSYRDWTGQRRQKLKRGFSTKRDAAAWEREVLEKAAGTPDITFKSLYDLYFEDAKARLKLSTWRNKKAGSDKHILHFFEQKPINKITPADIRKWQNELAGKKLKDSSCRAIYGYLSSIFNYAVKFHGLPKNPCSVVEPGKVAKRSSISFWTKDQFQLFIKHIDEPEIYTGLMVLFYAGLRVGELLALAPADIDLDKCLIYVSKTYHRFECTDLITSPKTENSCRTVTIPPFLADCLREYAARVYTLENEERFFCTLTMMKLRYAMKKGAAATGLSRIRIHDLRHSHVSLLIDLGFSPYLVAERIGDTVDMVQKIYGHLYPNRHQEVADRLQALNFKYQDGII